MALAPGEVIASKYVVERALGQGGMGAIYVVSHAQTGKRMAMKTLRPELVQNADIVSRFLREAQVMGRLHHRHVIDVFDVGRDGPVLYIVMELLEGKPLSRLMSDPTLSLDELLTILLRAMEGVAAAHEQGVVHRDLKPDNIFVCEGTSGRLDDPRVLDFGISKVEDPCGDKLTRSGIAMGTPNYMSFEQLSGGYELDARVDVYAMGVLLYEAIAGQLPFTAESVSALAIRVSSTDPVHLAELRPDLPDGLAGLVMSALARNRDQRPQSMRAFIQALRPYVALSEGLPTGGQGGRTPTPRSGGNSVARVQPTPATLSAQQQPGGGMNRGVWIACALVMAIGAVSAFLILNSAEPTPVPAASKPVPPVERPAKSTTAPQAVGLQEAPPPEHPPVQPELPVHHAEVARRHEPKKRPPKEHVEIAPVAEPPAVSAPKVAAPPAANSHKTAQGRAGKLGSDEF